MNTLVLRITFHETRGLSCAVEQLAIAARKALFAMLGKCQQMHIHSPLQKLHLFDALVRPVQDMYCRMHVRCGLLLQASVLYKSLSRFISKCCVDYWVYQTAHVRRCFMPSLHACRCATFGGNNVVNLMSACSRWMTPDCARWLSKCSAGTS